MNPIAKLSDKDLLRNTKLLVEKEKRITQEVLDHLQEIEYRKLYLSEGYKNLFDYCVKVLRYGEGSANRRIAAMRVINAIPEAKEKLESGSVNLSTLSQLQYFLNKESKEKTYTSDMKVELLEKIENKSQIQCEREFVKISPITKFKEREKALTEELTQFTFVASKELKAKLELLRNLTAHKNSNPTTGELIEILADISLKKLNPAEERLYAKKTSASATQSIAAAAKRRVKNFWRYIPKETRRFVWIRDEGCCQFIKKETNMKCKSKFALQIDHIHPFSLGGTNEKENLRLLCRNHNNWRTRELYKH
jgi:hypothetical protein